MSLFERLLQAVRSWRRRRGGVRTIRKSGVAMEQLDLRQMLSVTFTGNVAIDFPDTQVPGVVVLPDNPSVQHPVIGDAALQSLVRVSGFDISGLRVSYAPENNGTLFVGIEQPASQLRPGPVIAGDADNNGNSGSVNPAVAALGLGVQDPADFGGSEFMGIYLDFLGTGTAQIAAGFPQTVPAGGAPKLFTVATASQPGPNAAPIFVTPLPQHQGNIYTQNDPAHPNMELSIINFDTLYESITGSPLEPTSVFNVGAFAGSSVDGPISEAFFPAQPVLLSAATPPPEVCPPISPPIWINPHEHRIIDTTHRSLVRVYVQGTSGFDPATIDPATVDLNGAKPIATMPYKFAHSPFPARTFVFRASDIQADPGLQTLTFRAMTTDGQEIITSNQVLNVPNVGRVGGRLGFLANRGSRNESQYNALRRLAATNPEAILDPDAVYGGSTAAPASVDLGLAAPGAPSGLSVDYSQRAAPTGAVAPISPPREVVTLPKNQSGARLNARLNRTLEQYLAEAALAEAHDDAAPTPVGLGAY